MQIRKDLPTTDPVSSQQPEPGSSSAVSGVSDLGSLGSLGIRQQPVSATSLSLLRVGDVAVCFDRHTLVTHFSFAGGSELNGVFRHCHSYTSRQQELILFSEQPQVLPLRQFNF